MPCVPLSAAKLPFPHAVEKAGLLAVENILSDDTDTPAVDLEVYESQIRTTGSAGAENLAVPDGSVVGQRKLLTLAVLGATGDSVALVATNIHNASGTQATGVTFDAAGESLLVEWTGSEWQAIYTTATIATA